MWKEREDRTTEIVGTLKAAILLSVSPTVNGAGGALVVPHVLLRLCLLPAVSPIHCAHVWVVLEAIFPKTGTKHKLAASSGAQVKKTNTQTNQTCSQHQRKADCLARLLLSPHTTSPVGFYFFYFIFF